ncbi:MAG: DegQ family serine endoprotease [Pseudomonadota bacterium]
MISRGPQTAISMPRRLAGIGLATFLVAGAAAVSWSEAVAKANPEHAAANLKEVNVNNGFADLVDAVKPAVVNISVTMSAAGNNRLPEIGKHAPQLEEFFKRYFGNPDGPATPDNDSQRRIRKTAAVGSGFVIDPTGLVVTNNHVIENAEEIEVVFDDGTRLPATLRGTDSKTDLALLEVNADNALPYVKFGKSEQARIGDWVVAIGNPFGLGGTTTKGIISARGRDIRSGPLDDFIQIDAPINRGNSGGPLFNTRGEVIGVNSAIYSPNGGSVGIGFAIPSEMASNVIAQLQENGTVQRGFLGVHIQEVSKEIADSLGLDKAIGALVTEVMPDSPAERAGIESGDVIITYDGKEVTRMRDLPKLVAVTEKDKQVEVDVWRNDASVTIDVQVGFNADEVVASSGSQSDKKSNHQLGLQLDRVTDETRQKYNLDPESVGVVIVDIDPASSAAERGLTPGDVIRKVGSQKVETPEDVRDAIAASEKANKESVLLLVERDSRTRFIVVPMAS